MGILSTLLSGGALVGTLCKVAAGALSEMATYVDDETKAVFTSTNFNYDNTEFYLKNDKIDHVEFIAFNNDNKASKLLQFPTNEDGSSIMFEIPSKKSQEIGVDLKYCQNPDQVIGISTINGNLKGADSDDPVVVRMRVNNLKVGDPNSINDVNGYKINLEEDGVHIVSNRDDEPNVLQNFRLTTESGIEIVCDQNIASKTGTNSKEKVYPIDFKNYAIEENDKVSGELSLTLSKTAYKDFMLAGEKKRGVRIESSREDDYRFLKFIGVIK
ncbi:hypothetical protein [Candidatus Stoquefichus massiliensis]|uniref:hypothetical protein n=1 Tax=Candidatus Stoquefichus massiliensis TaxID=1470350 RepID=UPI000484455C|nr:hypothetical protein [Candidatus Stoquefichus massiliensis]